VEGFYKDCKYETNRKKIYVAGCGVGKKTDSLIPGTKHGNLKTYYQNGKLKSVSNFHCGLMQGNFYNYDEKGNLETQEFYFENLLKSSVSFNEKGFIEESDNIDYNFKRTRNYKTTDHKEFYENGDLKIENIIVEEEKDIETEHYKEYYQNGFLKIEKTLINNSKNGIYREYFENGNVKFEGKFKNGKPVEKQYFYREDGRIDKIETWKNNKLIPLKELKYNG
jgi:antitoxin component YwqK of YwqJK toxin-antitoxin module